MGRSSLFAAGALSLFLGSVTGQDSCVQVASPTWAATCPCDSDGQYSFTMEGKTTVTANTVNVAVIIDSSGSVDDDEWDMSMAFAKNAISSFADQNLFTNGGSASIAQFSSSASEGGTFYSLEDFNAFVDGSTKYSSGGTDIIDGIAKGRELLKASPATTSFMIVTTDGKSSSPKAEADAARDEGTIVYAVGVGTGPTQEILLDIGGEEANVFDVDGFDELDVALAGILSVSGSSVPCAATGATVTVEFNGMVTGATVDGGSATYNGGEVVFTVGDLEATPTDFEVSLDWCGEPEGGEIIASVSYADDEGNTPDLSSLEGSAVVPTCGVICPKGSHICDDPHMKGLLGQSIDWFGVDGEWYSFVKDPDMDLHVNVRLTAPLPEEFPDRQLVTGLSIISEGHSLVLEVTNPYSTDMNDGCPDGIPTPCLANGGLSVTVDGEKNAGLLHPNRGEILPGGIQVSADNLPVQCWQFGGHKIWARHYEAILARRKLRAQSFEDWVLSFTDMAAHDWCTEYINEKGLTDVQSSHAIYQIVTPAVVVRLNVGIGHQDGDEVDWDGRVLPDLDVWQMDVGLTGLSLENEALTGILGETARPVYDEDGHAVMEGDDAYRGTPEDYRVSGPLGIDFALLHQK